MTICAVHVNVNTDLITWPLLSTFPNISSTTSQVITQSGIFIWFQSVGMTLLMDLLLICIDLHNSTCCVTLKPSVRFDLVSKGSLQSAASGQSIVKSSVVGPEVITMLLINMRLVSYRPVCCSETESDPTQCHCTIINMGTCGKL